MSVPGASNPLLLTSAAGGGAFSVERSLRFDSDNSSYLYFQPPTDGTRTIWTLSFWMKRGQVAGTRMIYEADISLNESFVYLDGGSNLVYYDGTSGPAVVVNNSELKDYSAWYHIVLKYDSTQLVASDRLRFYVNGADDTRATSTWPSQNHPSPFSAASVNKIGTRRTNIQFFDGCLANIDFVDGTACDPSAFAETDATTNAWTPIQFSGSYGTNGFKLLFDDNSSLSSLGTDSSGQGNDWTPVNFVPASTGAASAQLLCCESTTTNTATLINSGNSLSTAGTVTAGSYTINSNSTGANDFSYPNSYISIAPSSSYAPSGARQPWTAEAFVYFDSFPAVPSILQWSDGSTFYFVPLQTDGSTFYCNASGTGGDFSLNVPYTFNTGQWYHMAAVCDGSRVSTYVNGTRIGTVAYTKSLAVISGYTTYIGAFRFSGGIQDEMDGKISNLRWTLAAVYDPNDTTITVPTVSLPTSVSDAILGPPTNIDSVFDSPKAGSQEDTGLGGQVSGNYCTWLNRTEGGASTSTFTKSNQSCKTSTSYTTHIKGTLPFPTSGKWYVEVTMDSGTYMMLGVIQADNMLLYTPSAPVGGYLNQKTESYVMYNQSGALLGSNSGSSTGAGATWVAGDTIGIALDMDNQQLRFWKNGSALGGFNSVTTSVPLLVAFSDHDTASSTKATLNAGQQPFLNPSVPSGYKALCTANIPDPLIVKPGTAMQVVDGNMDTTKTWYMDFEPDLVWIKSRNTTDSHVLTDRVRGTNSQLSSDTPNSEASNTNAVTSFNSDGFTIGAYGPVSNTSSVGWCWDSGSTTGTNSDGTISCSQRKNVSTGFSISAYTGNSTAGATLGHGLNVKPQFIIIKNRDAAESWCVYHASEGATKYAFLNVDNSFSASAALWNNTEPDASVITLGNYNGVNNGNNFICYAWAPVANYSAFGKYYADSTQPFVFTGFSPRYILIKNTDINVTSWCIHDTERNPINYVYTNLRTNSNGGDNGSSGYPLIDIVSNGFKVINTFQDYNYSSNGYVWAAFAEFPFKFAPAR